MPGWMYKAALPRSGGVAPMLEFIVVWEADPVKALAALHAARPDLHPDTLEAHASMRDEAMRLLGMIEGGVRVVEIRL